MVADAPQQTAILENWLDPHTCPASCVGSIVGQFAQDHFRHSGPGRACLALQAGGINERPPFI